MANFYYQKWPKVFPKNGQGRGDLRVFKGRLRRPLCSRHAIPGPRIGPFRLSAHISDARAGVKNALCKTFLFLTVGDEICARCARRDRWSGPLPRGVPRPMSCSSAPICFGIHIGTSAFHNCEHSADQLEFNGVHHTSVGFSLCAFPLVIGS